VFVGISVAFAWIKRRAGHGSHGHKHDHEGGADWLQRILLVLAAASIVWLAVGVVFWFTV